MTDYSEIIQSLAAIYRTESLLERHLRAAGPIIAAIDHETHSLEAARTGFDGKSPLAETISARVFDLSKQRAKFDRRINAKRLLLEQAITGFADIHGVDPGELSLGSKPSNGTPNELIVFLLAVFEKAGIGRHPDTIWKDAQRFRTAKRLGAG